MEFWRITSSKYGEIIAYEDDGWVYPVKVWDEWTSGCERVVCQRMRSWIHGSGHKLEILTEDHPRFDECCALAMRHALLREGEK